MPTSINITLADDDFEDAREIKEEIGLTWEGFIKESTRCLAISRGVETSKVDREDTIESLLIEYRKGRNREERKERRRVAKAALEWLRDRGGPASGSDFKEELLPTYEVEGSSVDTWWRNTVRPALQLAIEHELVEYRPGHHDYRWVGE